jgi:hypothetical protein
MQRGSFGKYPLYFRDNTNEQTGIWVVGILVWMKLDSKFLIGSFNLDSLEERWVETSSSVAVSDTPRMSYEVCDSILT